MLTDTVSSLGVSPGKTLSDSTTRCDLLTKLPRQNQRCKEKKGYAEAA